MQQRIWGRGLSQEDPMQSCLVTEVDWTDGSEGAKWFQGQIFRADGTAGEQGAVPTVMEASQEAGAAGEERRVWEQ